MRNTFGTFVSKKLKDAIGTNRAFLDDVLMEFLVPKGTIVFWSGTTSNIPSGWHICDGTDGTPDLMSTYSLSHANPYPLLTTHTATGTLWSADITAYGGTAVSIYGYTVIPIMKM